MGPMGSVPAAYLEIGYGAYLCRYQTMYGTAIPNHQNGGNHDSIVGTNVGIS
jgi:hypothetical protein